MMEFRSFKPWLNIANKVSRDEVNPLYPTPENIMDLTLTNLRVIGQRSPWRVQAILNEGVLDYDKLHSCMCQSALDSETNSWAISVYKSKQTMMEEPHYQGSCIAIPRSPPLHSRQHTSIHHFASWVVVGDIYPQFLQSSLDFLTLVSVVFSNPL